MNGIDATLSQGPVLPGAAAGGGRQKAGQMGTNNCSMGGGGGEAANFGCHLEELQYQAAFADNQPQGVAEVMVPPRILSASNLPEECSTLHNGSDDSVLDMASGHELESCAKTLDQLIISRNTESPAPACQRDTVEAMPITHGGSRDLGGRTVPVDLSHAISFTSCADQAPAESLGGASQAAAFRFVTRVAEGTGHAFHPKSEPFPKPSACRAEAPCLNGNSIGLVYSSLDIRSAYGAAANAFLPAARSIPGPAAGSYHNRDHKLDQTADRVALRPNLAPLPGFAAAALSPEQQDPFRVVSSKGRDPLLGASQNLTEENLVEPIRGGGSRPRTGVGNFCNTAAEIPAARAQQGVSLAGHGEFGGDSPVTVLCIDNQTHLPPARFSLNHQLASKLTIAAPASFDATETLTGYKSEAFKSDENGPHSNSPVGVAVEIAPDTAKTVGVPLGLQVVPGTSLDLCAPHSKPVSPAQQITSCLFFLAATVPPGLGPGATAADPLPLPRQAIAASDTSEQAHQPLGADKIQTMRLMLEPQHLGGVTISLRLTKSGLDVRVEAEQLTTAQLINEEKGLIAAKLKSVGYDIGTLLIQQTDIQHHRPKLSIQSTSDGTQTNDQLGGGSSEHNDSSHRGRGRFEHPPPRDEQDGFFRSAASGELFI